MIPVLLSIAAGVISNLLSNYFIKKYQKTTPAIIYNITNINYYGNVQNVYLGGLSFLEGAGKPRSLFYSFLYCRYTLIVVKYSQHLNPFRGVKSLNSQCLKIIFLFAHLVKSFCR